ncbi:PQQ-binding-like beta-propeller repeat protein [Kitasatospora sp. RB6PN24]|uniref:outer membrane protein assembly factor BamB family protein n=1 Tax=Kitasatospora humi TaxID=2893891 RepID=UPI001E58C1D6|nr:PQQ-binding-like beta-propeller repeat protein [Kitasatospora humi]MCC9309967.1 PQQ-binding-like beta-propeller repeat protein [Kitasatospora humi]
MLGDAAQPSATGTVRDRPAVTLSGTTAFVTAESGIEAFDTASGRKVWAAGTVTPAPTDGTVRAAPLVASMNGQPAVFAAFDRVVQGTGTAPSRTVIEILAANASTGAQLWDAQVDSTPSPDDFMGQDDGLVADGITAGKVIGVNAQTLVVTEGETTYVLDLSSRQLRWKRPSFQAIALDGGIVAGEGAPSYGQRQLAGYAAQDNSTTWSVPPVGAGHPASLAGPGLIAIDTTDGFDLLETKTGAARANIVQAAGHIHPWSCEFDQASVIACSDEAFNQADRIVALDATTLKQLWTLAATPGGRLVPSISAAWHGALYGHTSNGPVILDGRNGTDRATPEFAPILVDAYAVVYWNEGEVSATPATG